MRVKLKLLVITLGAACCIPAVIFNCLGQTADPATQPRQEQTQHHRDSDWLRRYKDLSPEQREKTLRIDKEFSVLSPHVQQQLLQHLRHFSSLPPDEQQRILNRMDIWENMTPQQRQRAHELFQLAPTTPARP
ncbi:MAG: DUF3106 domain-containing protein [Terriglobales bacterium]|jgi:hypothetical protein